MGMQWVCRYSLLKAWTEATSQVKTLHRDVKRHTLTSRKLTGLLDFTLRTEQRRRDGNHSGHFRPPDTNINAQKPLKALLEQDQLNHCKNATGSSYGT